MHLLPCPQCQQTITVSPSQAGDEIRCSACDTIVAIPRLGELRQLPLADQAADAAVVDRGQANVGGRQVVITLLGLIALVGVIVCGFAAIRWFLVEPTASTQSHIDEIRVAYEDLDAARFIREFEDMENISLDMPAMYVYKVKSLEKQRWGIIALISGLGTLLAGAATIWVASSSRTTKS
ncbi:MAG: hypothetical protein HKN47_20795 [Pirellulaceae bacterium]|nr:hypothetical protein [Pirellulaceae bacterium]